MDELDKKIIRRLQGEFPLVPRPYARLAEEIGIDQDVLLARLQQYRRQGLLRKMGAVLRHREVGFKANALCVWVVPENEMDRVGRVMSAHPRVTHCYARRPQAEWRYNFYTMVHGRDEAECRAIAAQLAQQAGVDDYALLFSVKEWKKATMRYFTEDGETGIC